MIDPVFERLFNPRNLSEETLAGSFSPSLTSCSIRQVPMRMEARFAPFVAFLLTALLQSPLAAAGTFQTQNFAVTAPSEEIAKQVGETAEFYRRELAKEWLGEELPRWYRPCPISVKVGQIGAGGATTFTFEGGEVFGWRMNVQGSLERILDSVIPHEVTHTIFACHFRRPLPRWADEGAATLIENESERLRQVDTLNRVIRARRRIPLQQLLAIKEYPQDYQQVMTLYAEGYSLASFLVQRGGRDGKAIYLNFLADAMEGDWATAFRKHYGYENLGRVEREWTGWVLAGSPPLKREDGTMLAGTTAPAASHATQTSRTLADARVTPAGAEAEVRGQSPRELDPLPRINRPMRSRQAGRNLSAPEPNVTAMPEFFRGGLTADTSSGTQTQAPLAPPARTRPADLWEPATSGSSPEFAATRQAADSGLPRERTGDRATWPDERTDGLFSP